MNVPGWSAARTWTRIALRPASASESEAGGSASSSRPARRWARNLPDDLARIGRHQRAGIQIDEISRRQALDGRATAIGHVDVEHDAAAPGGVERQRHRRREMMVERESGQQEAEGRPGLRPVDLQFLVHRADDVRAGSGLVADSG